MSGFSNISVGNALGGSLYIFEDDLLLDPVTIDPIRWLEWNVSAGTATEIFDGVDFEAAAPEGEEETFNQPSRTALGTLADLRLEVEDALASISINPFELLDDVPALAGLDVPTEEFDTPEFDVLGNTYQGSLEYVLVKPSISGG